MSLKFDSVTVTVLNVCGNVLGCVCAVCLRLEEGSVACVHG